MVNRKKLVVLFLVVSLIFVLVFTLVSAVKFESQGSLGKVTGKDILNINSASTDISSSNPTTDYSTQAARVPSFKDARGENIFDEEDASYFSIPKESNTNSLKINKLFSKDSTFSLDYSNKISSLSLNANFSFNSDDLNNFVRIILIDNKGNEYLIFEANSMFYSEKKSIVENICEETCNLADIIPSSLRIELSGGSVYIDSLNIQRSDSSTKKLLSSKENYKQQQNNIKIKRLNENIKSKGLEWVAGETPISNVNYSEKRLLFGVKPGQKLPNTYGFEYYKGGIFEIPRESTSSSLLESIPIRTRAAGTATFGPTSWDWRNVSGENWMTPVKNQGSAGTCFIFSLMGAMESQMNLYYNQHLNLDLSEQQMADCANNNTAPFGMSNSYTQCKGNNMCYPGYNACVVSQHGIADEKCDPYAQRNINTPGNCSLKNICGDWQSRLWKNSGFWDYNFVLNRGSPTCPSQTMNLNESEFKKILITKGPLDSGINSWNHAMVLVGYNNTPTGTVWIFKNSWGTAWGEGGYGRVKVTLADLGWGSLVLGPFTPPTNKNYWPIGFDGNVKCFDKDKDGYCNWGTTDAGLNTAWRAQNCPASCLNNPKKDCDDSSKYILGFDSNFNCQKVVVAIKTCTAADWKYNLTPLVCPSNQIQLKRWTKINDCAGGISHPASEYIKCIYALL